MKRVAIALVLMACGGAKPVASVEIPLPQSQGQSGVYAFRFDHPSRVGERSRWVITADEERITTTRRGAEITSDEHAKKRGRIDAIATVMTLDATGKMGDLLFDIADLSYADDARELVHKKRGKLLLVRGKREADAKVTFDGVDATDDMREAAKLLFTLTNDGPDDDEVMGPPGPQRVGSHWRVDGKRAAEALAEEEGGEMLNGAQISGDAWIEGVGLVSGIECLDVHAIIHIDNLDLAAKLGAGGGADVARITMTLSAKVPTDASRGRIADHQLVEATVKIRTPSPNGEVTLETNYALRRDGIYEALNPEGGASR
jgi:hypothetical protein